MLSKEISNIVDDEASSYNAIQRLRSDFSPNLFNSVRADSRQEAVDRAIEVTRDILSYTQDSGLNFRR